MKYSINIQPYLDFSGADNVNVDANSGTQVCDITIGQDNYISKTSTTCKFTATSTDLDLRVSSITAATLRGDGAIGETEATLCQLPDNTILNSNKWD